MSINGLVRDYGVNPSIVRMLSSDSYATITSAGYLTSQMADFNRINGGAFQWNPSDMILCYYLTGWQFFTLSSDFSSLTPFLDGGVNPSQVQSNYFNYGADSGVANAYIINLPSTSAVPLTAGFSIIGQMLHNNTTTSTLTVNGYIAPVVNISGISLSANEIIAGSTSVFIYSSSFNAFVLIDSAVTPGTGTVGFGNINQLAYYAADGTTLSGLASADNGLLTTNGIGVPSISNTIGADISVNGITVGQGGFTQGTPTNASFGYIALEANTSGTNNTAVGNGSLQSVVGSSNNSVFGYNSLISNDGDYNSTLGSNVAISLGIGSNGNYNCLFGGQVGNGGGNASSSDLLGGDYNTLIGYYASVNSYTTNAAIGIGAYSNADAATGSTSLTYGPGISIGSSYYPVGFRGDGSPIPAGSANYWRMKVNDTYYNLPLITDGAALLWPASGTLATTANSVASIQGTANQVLVNGTSGSPVTGTAVTLTLPQDIATNSTPIFSGLNDANNVPILQFDGQASAINYIQIQNAATALDPSITSVGSNVNIGLDFISKGTGGFLFATESTGNCLFITSGSGYAHQTNLSFPATLNAVTIAFPDASGTIALTSQLPSSISPLSATNGGTGVNNGSSTITIGGNTTFSGAHSFTGTLTADTSVTFPTSGTLLTASTGTWTPTLTGSATAGSTTYSIQQGYYYLIGKMCHITCYVAVSVATGTGDITIGGLPFTISNQTDYYPVGAAVVSSVAQPFPSGTTMISAVGILNTATCVFAASGTSNASSNLQVANTVVRFQFSMSFITT